MGPDQKGLQESVLSKQIRHKQRDRDNPNIICNIKFQTTATGKVVKFIIKQEINLNKSK